MLRQSLLSLKLLLVLLAGRLVITALAGLNVLNLMETMLNQQALTIGTIPLQLALYLHQVRTT